MSRTSDILAGLRQDIPRWQAELESPANVRTTMYAGIAQRCCSGLEILLKGCARFIVRHAGEGAQGAVSEIGRGKPHARFTMGENIHVIRKLHSAAEQSLGLNNVLFAADLDSALGGIVKMRNQVQHPTPETARPELLSGMTLRLLESAAVFCASVLVTRAAADDDQEIEHVG